MSKPYSRYDFVNASDEEVLAAIRTIYSEDDLPLLADYPGIEVLKEWAKSGFSDEYLRKKKFSDGLQDFMKLSLKERKII